MVQIIRNDEYIQYKRLIQIKISTRNNDINEAVLTSANNVGFSNDIGHIYAYARLRQSKCATDSVDKLSE